jgi:hypothetical protein
VDGATPAADTLGDGTAGGLIADAALVVGAAGIVPWACG